ncbi:transporter [Seiridium cupressi]
MSDYPNPPQPPEQRTSTQEARGSPSPGSITKATLHEHDVEANRPTGTQRSEAEKPVDASTTIIGWDGDNDPENPYNWPAWRTNSYAGLLSFLAFLIPLASSILAPAVPAIMRQFGSEDQVLEALVVSIYVLGLGLGPMIFAPLSEIYGRVVIYNACNVAFIAFHVACATAPSLNSLIAFRFLAGFFGSCPTTNGGASIADMVPQDRRGGFMAAFVIGPILGPVIGPVAGGFLATAAGWRWVFWLVTIVAGFVSLVFLLLAKETYAPVLLQRKVVRLRRETGNPNIRHEMDKGLSAGDMLKLSIVRPLKLLFLTPIGAISAFYLAVVYGYLYLMFSSITQVFIETYGFSSNIASLAFLGIGVGSIIGLAIISATSDRLLKRQKDRNNGVAKPEVRIQILPIGGFLLPAGLFLYGWSSDYAVHWIAPIIGMALIGMGNSIMFLCILTYLVDVFTIHAASALAANTLFRSLGGAFLPLAGLKLFSALGLGWGNSLLGFIGVAMLPVPFLFLRYGEYLRTRYEIKNL